MRRGVQLDWVNDAVAEMYLGMDLSKASAFSVAAARRAIRRGEFYVSEQKCRYASVRDDASGGDSEVAVSDADHA